MIDILTNDYRQPVLPPQYSFVELDMGCGRGKFTLELAKRFPDRLILASDVMLGRLRKLDLKVQKRSLANVILLRAESGQLAEFQLPPHSIDRLHILCPDPWPKERHHKNRLLRPDFLVEVARVLKPGKRIFYWGTDHQEYNEVALEVFDNFKGCKILERNTAEPTEGIMTGFEKKYRKEGRPIYRSVVEFEK